MAHQTETRKTMKYFIIAGEASGDLHASNLIKALKEKDPSAEFTFLGGYLMQEATNQSPLIHYNQMAFMGVVDVIKNIGKIYKNLKQTKKALLEFNPDVVILVDYPGFNLKMAAFAKKHHYKTIYYISPKLWAWKEGRVKQIRKYVDQLLTILPFETEFFAKHQIKANYVGNPVVDAVQNHKALSKSDFLKQFNLPDKPIIALLPGSRKQELKMMLPTMLTVVDQFPEYQFVISGAPSFTQKDYEPFLTKDKNIPVIFNHTYDLLQHSHSAIVTSGTAALETALFEVPQVVVYKTHQWQYAIGKHLVKIPYFSLPNLIMKKEIIMELLQNDFNTERLAKELKQINDGAKRQEILADYQDLKNLLGHHSASVKAAGKIIDFIKAN
jgi:lipid-A-disaccharide synthase